MESQYNRHKFAEALEQAGLKCGDVVFSHSNVGFFGYPEEGKNRETVFKIILNAFKDVIGEKGTLVVPTFTYSFCKRQPFDLENTQSTCGFFTEMLRLYPSSRRSCDPIFSVAALGRLAEDLTANVANECFGKDSFWDRFLQADGIICNLNLDAGSTFIHFVERCLNVPYRYDKLFPGQFIQKGQFREGVAIYFCSDLSNSDSEAAFEPFDAIARKRGYASSVPVGRGAIVSIKANDVYRLIKQELKGHPWLLTAAGKFGKIPVVEGLAGKMAYDISLPDSASMKEIIKAIYPLPRDIISDGYDCALNALAKQIQMTIHEYPTGSHCWTWIVPEKWTCHEAYLESMDGKKIFSYTTNPLHVVSYSLPFEGVISRQKLFERLYVDPNNPNAVPFVYKYYDRDWGLCCSDKLKTSLTDEYYKVKIKSSVSFGTLKVGEVVAKGKSEQCIVLCAHLCHPAIANDGLVGVVTGLEVMRTLIKRNDLRFTYRFLILPETIGSIAFLSHNENLIEKMEGGIFLEALGLEYPHALQLSYEANTEFDRCCIIALKDQDPNGWVGEFLKVITNDERQFNAPGVRVPMLSLSRVINPEEGKDFYLYPGYHTDLDNADSVSYDKVHDSVELILHMIETWESNRVPVNNFKGEVFLTRYGINFDFANDPIESQALFEVMCAIDGRYSILGISEKLGIPFSLTKKIIQRFDDAGLVDYL